METTDPRRIDRHSSPGTWQRSGRWYKIGLFIAVLAVITYFIGRTIWSQWDVIRDHPWHFHPGWLVWSAALIWLDFLILVQLWRYLLFTVSGKWLRLGCTFRILVLSNLGKYIPGKVWTVLGMVYMLGREGYGAPSALASTVLHQAFTLISGAVFIAVVLGFEVFSGLSFFPLILVSVLCVVILYPPLFSRLLNRGLLIFKREPMTIQLSFAKSVGLFAVYIIAWIVYGTSFWFLLRGIGISEVSFWETVAAFCAAYILGFLVLFAPGGLGVREGVLVVLLAPQLGHGVAAIVAVVARLWMTVMELTELVPLAFGWGRSKTTKSKTP